MTRLPPVRSRVVPLSYAAYLFLVARAEGNLKRAHQCITEAGSKMEGFEVPLAAWRVQAGILSSTIAAERGPERSGMRIREKPKRVLPALRGSAGDVPEESPGRIRG